MRKSIEFDGRNMELVANGATPIRFKQIFKNDLFKSLQTGAESVEAIETVMQLAFVMVMQAKGANFNQLKYDDFVTWLEDFSPMAFVENPDTILNCYMETMEPGSKAKKK